MCRRQFLTMRSFSRTKIVCSPCSLHSCGLLTWFTIPDMKSLLCSRPRLQPQSSWFPVTTIPLLHQWVQFAKPRVGQDLWLFSPPAIHTAPSNITLWKLASRDFSGPFEIDLCPAAWMHGVFNSPVFPCCHGEYKSNGDTLGCSGWLWGLPDQTLIERHPAPGTEISHLTTHVFCFVITFRWIKMDQISGSAVYSFFYMNEDIDKRVLVFPVLEVNMSMDIQKTRLLFRMEAPWNII